MASSPIKKGNKISQIVRLKQVMQRWRRRCIATAAHSSDSDSETDLHPPHCRSIPSPGSLVVYVGIERRRFVIPTMFLNLPVFRALLNKAEEEFGFQKTGGLVLPCDVVFFRRLLKTLERNERGLGGLDLDGFTAMFAGSGERGRRRVAGDMPETYLPAPPLVAAREREG